MRPHSHPARESTASFPRAAAAAGTALLLFAAGAAGAAGAVGAAWAGSRDSLVIGMAQFPSTLHPDISPEVVKSYVLAFTQRPISAYDAAWKPVCVLCETLPSLENGLAVIEDRGKGGGKEGGEEGGESRRGMRITLRLKPGLAWGDGVPVTARDIAFTWKMATAPGSGFGNTYQWSRASRVEVIDDRTAVLHTDRVLTNYMMWDQVLPAHLEGTSAQGAASPAEYVRQTLYAREPTTPGLYNGPYVVAAFQSGQQIVLEPNPHWTGHAPGIRRVVLRTIENTAALQANLLSGDVDMVAGDGIGLTIDQVLALRKQAPDRFSYVFKPSLNYEHIDLNLDNPLLRDARTRRALVMATDRFTLVDRLFEGLQPVAATFVNPLHPMFDPAVKPVPFDPAGARALLAEAGWTPGPDGICRDAAGARLSLEIATTAGNRLRELMQQVLQNQWKAACVEVRIRNEPARTLFGEALKQRRFTGMVLSAWSSSLSESPRRTLDSSEIPSAANGYSGSNYTGFCDTAMDGLIAAVEGELVPAKARAGWAEMQRIYAAETPAIPLFFRVEPHVAPKWLQEYVPLGNGYNVGLFAEWWHPS